ncbi:MAG: response regulator, partial [Candidatus Dormiibacterota bacterium]
RGVIGSGRMVAGTVIFLCALSVALLALDWPWAGPRPSEWIAWTVATVALLALIGDLFRVGQLAGIAGASQMAVSTGITLILLSIAVIASRPQHVIFKAVAGPDAGARFVRRFGLISISIPFLLGFTVFEAGQAGAFGANFALSLGTFGAMGVGIAGVLIASMFVRRAELAGVGRREAEVFKMIVQTATEGVWTTDDLGRNQFMNDRMLEMLGYQASELIGRRALDLAPADIRELQNARMQDRLWGRSETYETAFVRKDGSILWALVGATPMLDAAGKPAGSLAMVSDLTSRRAAEEELKVARSEALEATRLKSEFLASMSHEIRTPMSGLLGMVELLRATALDQEQASYAEAISRSGVALMTIINDILDISKIEAGKLEIEAIDFKLRLVVEEVAELMARHAQDKGIELVVAINPGIPEWVRGDPMRLRQVILNLVSNAVKFTDRGEIVVSVQPATGAAVGRRIEFEVSDTGAGIDEATQKRLFEKFAQADASTARKVGGSGLGLAISRQLVRLMGGEIGVRSEPGKGSEFYFTCVFGESGIGYPEPTAPVGDLKGLRVLLVDGSTTNRQVLEEAMRRWHVEVQGGGLGMDALALLTEAAAAGKPYNVVLLDSRMPDLDGFAIARMIRRKPALAGLITVLMSPVTRRVGAQDEVVDAFLTKPVKIAALRECLTIASGRAPTAPLPQAAAHPVPVAVTGSGPLLLVVDDNPVNQRVSTTMLRKLGYRADLASNGIEAVSASAEHEYAAILMDCVLPEMDGFEATAAIRLREGSARHTPIIAMTASAMKGDLERCIAAGMDAYVSKPVKMAQLGEIIATWVESSRARSAPDPSLNGHSDGLAAAVEAVTHQAELST